MKLLRMFYKDKDLVVSATRTEKNISQVAENITVITSEEIEIMNAHSMADVLNSVPGMFIGSNKDFMSVSIITIQGSEERHVLLLLDGVPYNSIAGGNPETSTIPLGAVERIEIIKGPASSAWGSSLGGVINVITKKAGTGKKPSGAVRASYGKAKSQDFSGEISGKTGTVGYYFFAGDQSSNGLVSTRSFDGKQFLSKLAMPLLQKGGLSFEAGYTSLNVGFGDFPDYDMNSGAVGRSFHAIGSLELSLAEDLDLKVSLFDLKKNLQQDNRAMGLGMFGPEGTMIKDIIFEEKKIGASTQLVYATKAHAAVLGVDYNNGKLTQTILTGPVYQMYGAPSRSVVSPDMTEWAVYANDSISLGNFAITPGIRYDRNSNTGSFVSPSLGSTYRLRDKTVIRGSISRGFTSPALATVSGGGLFLDPNPYLMPEKILSCQGGIESSAIPHVWAKLSLFHHRVHDIQTLSNVGPPTFNSIIINGGKSIRKGFEVEAATIPAYNVSLSSGYSYVRISPANENRANRMYTFDAGVIYDDGESMQARLKGRYVWWDTFRSQGRYGDFIWDCNINKKIIAYQGVTSELFLTAHNIFNGLQYVIISQINPGRWLEAGVKLHF